MRSSPKDFTDKKNDWTEIDVAAGRKGVVCPSICACESMGVLHHHACTRLLSMCMVACVFVVFFYSATRLGMRG